MENIELIIKLSNNKCELDNTNSLTTLSYCDTLDYKVQEDISCYIKSILKKHSINTEFKLNSALKSIQNDFKITPLSKPEDSEQGMTVKLSTKLFNYPFAILKFSKDITPIQEDNIIHEILVGMVLNSIRKYTPNFMYTYGGFICSPPIDRSIINKMKEYEDLNSIGKLTEPLLELYYDTINDEDDIEEIENKDVFIEYLPTFFSTMRRLRYKWINTHNFKVIKMMKNECVEVLEETKQFHSNPKKRDKELLKEYLSEVEIMLDNILKNERRFKEAALYFEENTDNIVNQDLLCSGEDKSVLLISEFFNKSISFTEFIREEQSIKDINDILFQIILSLVIANKTFKFKHNDLHTDNILIQPNNCILHYTLNNKDIYLEPRYIVRIIDYGYSECIYDGKHIKPNLEDYEDKSSISDLQNFRKLEELFSPYISTLMDLKTFDKIEEFILSNDFN